MLRTTTVGSWPIPFGVKPRLTQYYKGVVSDEAARGFLQDAARIAMDEQLACGIGQIMGGEVFAPDFVHHIPPRLEGIAVERKRDHRAGYEGAGRYHVEGEISAPRGTGHALAYQREREIEPTLDKAAVPSVWTIAGPTGADTSNPSQMEQISKIVEAEVRGMAAAGVAEIQLDAPNEAISLILGTRTVEEIVPWLVKPFKEAPGITRSLHFCLGDMGRRPATQEQHIHSLLPLIQALDGHVDRVHVECSYAGQWAERDLFRQVPESIEVIAGIADVKSEPQSVEELTAKASALLEVLPPERLLLSSSCGCGRVPHDQAITLMRNLVKAAEAAG